MKKCRRCEENLETNLFGVIKKNIDGLSIYCKPCERKRGKEYMEKNREDINKRKKEYKKANAERLDPLRRISQKKHYQNNKDIYLNRVKEYQSKNREKINKRISIRYKEDELLRIKRRISALISISLKRKSIVKNSKSISILGCDYVFFKEYIKNQFTKKMTWENIHLDHIKPIDSASTEKEVYDLNHYTNFQPLLIIDNIKKSNKLIEKQLKFI